MIKHDLADLFRENSVHKKFVINYDGGTITNSDLFMEEFSLEESISSEEELRFGSCEASVVKFPISNVFTPLNGKVLDVSVVLDHNEDKPLKIGKYKVASDVPTADRKRKDITAYDALYDVINTDVAEWYNALLPNNDSTVTLKQFRDSFFGYFGIEQVEVSLINDAMVVTKTIQPTELSGSMVANAICELNGCFGHINRDGLMDYVFLKGFTEAVYPSDDLYPADDLFPEDSNYHKYTKADYPSGGCQYEDYAVRKITGLEIRQEENSVGAFVGTKENPYVVSDNFLAYGKSTEEMTRIAQNMFNVINGIEYRPFTLNTFRGNPCVEVGDGIRIYTDNQIIESYVLHRTLTGIQLLRDNLDASGKEYRTGQVNTIEKSLIQLRGKTNTLERTVEETRSEIKDVGKGLSSRITQTAGSIETEVSRATKAEGELSSRITQTADMIVLGIDTNGNIVTDLTLDANGMTFVGNYIVIDTANLKLDANGAQFSGYVDATTFYVKDGVYMYGGGITLPTSARKIVSWDTTSIDDYKPLVIGDGYSAVVINGTMSAGIASLGSIDISGSTLENMLGNINLSASAGTIGFYSSGWRPTDAYKDSLNLGASSVYWNAIYSKDGTISKSDRNMKHDIQEISEKYEQLFFELKPRLYIFNNGKRVHVGAISQDVEEALEKVGLTAEEFAGFCKDQLIRDVIDKNGNLTEEPVFDDDGNPVYIYSLRYEEFIMLIAHMEQKAHKRIDEQQKTINSQQAEIGELKKSVSFLMEKLGGMDNE